MLDVHPPHEAVHGPRDFFLHLFTITIGLLIALGLENLVEWQHHRHLVHEAEASLYREIQSNDQGLPGVIADIHKQQDTLKQDLVVLNYIIKNGKAPKDGSTSISARIVSFDSVAWRTAQSTGALAYMPYAAAQQYSDIYYEQEQLDVAEQQAARDAVLSLGPLADADDNNPDPFAGRAAVIKDRVETLQAQLFFVEEMFKGLDGHYKKFLATYKE